jgi:hypothetical protein
MKCLDNDHRYELDTFLGEGKGMHPGEYKKPFTAFLGFYEMRPDGTKIDGVTNEEVLAVLIHRMKVLDEKWPCDENRIAIKNLEGALVWLTLRTQDRTERGVEGTHQA